MKIIIKENKRDKIVTDWLDKNYGKLLIIPGPDSVEIHYNEKGERIFSYYPNIGTVHLNNDLVDLLVSIFDFGDKDLNNVITPWIKKRYKIPIKRLDYRQWWCPLCGRYHVTTYHIED